MTSPLALLLPWLGALALAAAPPTTRTLDGLRPGQEGLCHTVFAGDEVEPMTFVVRGVMRNYLGPGRHVLLIRLTGDKPEFSGVVSGMSGSPCFVDGKLVGALSYSFASFAKEPIAGVTPIGDMLDILRLPATTLPWRVADLPPGAGAPPAGAGQASWPGEAHKRVFGGSLFAEDDAPASLPWPAAASPASLDNLAQTGLRPIATPLSIAGVGASMLAPWLPALQAQGFAPQRAGASAQGAANRVPQPLVPGGAVAAVLVRGDVDVAATGTVSWVNGNQVLAFGHPFFGGGPVSFPMANATIVNTMASAQHSFKMATTGATVGEVTQDRLSAIAGEMGKQARMVPVEGRIHHAGSDQNFAFEVVRDPEMTPKMLAMALAGALEGRVQAQGRGTVHLDASLSVGGAPPVRFRQVAAAQHSGHMLARLANVTAGAFNLLWNAPDGATPGNAQLHVEVTIQDTAQLERVEALRLGGGRAEAGSCMEAAVELSRQDAPPTTARFRFALPKSWAGESVALYAAGAAAAQQLVQELTGEPRPQNRQQVAAWLQTLRRPDALYLLAVRSGPSLQRGGENYAFLPPSAVVLLAHQPGHVLGEQGLGMELSQKRPGAVVGVAHARLQVAHAR